MSRIRFFHDCYQQLNIAFYIDVFQNESKFRSSNKVYPFYYGFSYGIVGVLRLHLLLTKMMHTMFYILYECN